MSDQPGTPGATAPRPSRILWFYRFLAAVGIPVVFFAVLELGLRLAGYGQPAGFLIPDARPGYVRTNPEFVSLFLPRNFDLRPLNFRVAEKKPANTVRIVILGESAAQGVPMPSFAFAPQLRAQLRARYPGRDIEVLDTGIVAINSHVIYRIARDMAAVSPDLYLVYMGNNEVVGPYGPGCAYLSEMPPLWLIRLSVAVRATRLGQLAGALVSRLGAHAGRPKEWGGMSMFVNNAVAGDDPRLESVYRNFQANLRDIVRVADAAGARTLVCTVASNLKDCPPLLSVHRAGLGGTDLAAWTASFERGRRAWRLGESGPARRALTEAQRLDPAYAETAYLLGQLDLMDGRVDDARGHLVEAEHLDALRFRPDPRINEAIRRFATASATPLLDLALELGSDPRSTVPPAGREFFFEHVHFDWLGNVQAGRRMAESAEQVLFGRSAGAPAWLDERGVGAALAYTAHERLAILQRIGAITDNPPFTNQLTYCEDAARLAHDLAVAQAAAHDASVLAEASVAVAAASIRDPGNPALAKIAEEIADDRGDLDGALQETRRAQALQPETYALPADEAIKLSRLGRYPEAETLLEKAQAICLPADRPALAPAFADLYVRTRRFDDARKYLDALVADFPADGHVRLIRGNLLRLSGDAAGAEREFRRSLVLDPADSSAQEALVMLLVAEGRNDDAVVATLAAVDRQPRNLPNNLRAAIVYESRKDRPQVIRSLVAAEASGPVTAHVEEHLARSLFGEQRYPEALERLAIARRISWYEDDPRFTASLDQAIRQLRAEVE